LDVSLNNFVLGFPLPAQDIRRLLKPPTNAPPECGVINLMTGFHRKINKMDIALV
jgi:hypothetical protein